MTIATSRTATADSAVAPPLPSLGPVLEGLGHTCSGSCGQAADELSAKVWFIRRRLPRAGRTDSTLVVLDASDYEGPMSRSRDLMRTVNDCVRDDGIRVTERRIDDSGRALASVSSLRAGSSVLRPASVNPFPAQARS
jgi:hypothetical protein